MNFTSKLAISFSFVFTAFSCLEKPAVRLVHFDCETHEITSGITAKIIDSIANLNVLMGSAVSVAGTKPKQFERYERLMTILPSEKLSDLCFHKNPAVRSYAFQGMMQTAHPETYEAFKLLLQDTTSVSKMYGCTGDVTSVSSQIMSFFYSESSLKGHYQPKPNERIFTDSLWLNDTLFTSDMSRHSFANIYPVERHYDALKQICTNGNHKDAIIGLANFQKEIDLPLFIECFKNRKFYDTRILDLDQSMGIVSRFPHPAFIPELKRIQSFLLSSENDLREFEAMTFYLAVFQYSPTVISSFVEDLKHTPASYTKTALQSGLWLTAQLNNNPEKRQFAPKIERDEWLDYILVNVQELVEYDNLH